MNRPTMNPTFQPVSQYREPLTSKLGSGVTTLIRWGLILGVVLTVGYLAGESLGLWDLQAGSTIETIQDRHSDTAEVMGMLRGN